MILRELYYHTKCDHCGKIFQLNNRTDPRYKDRRVLVKDMKSIGWRKGAMYWFCPECEKTIKRREESGETAYPGPTDHPSDNNEGR